MNIILTGACGRMGRTVARLAEKNDDMVISAGVDTASPADPVSFPVFSTFEEITQDADALIDFSGPALLAPLLDFCMSRSLPAVIASTGFDDEGRHAIRNASEQIAVFYSANMSIGISLITALAREAARVIGLTSDIEIVERHHSLKADSPSGTALALADAVSEEIPGSMEFVYGRHDTDSRRASNEIGIHSVRGGTIVGDHEVMFLRPDEEVVISHHAYSRDIFAQGALAAARFIVQQSPGLYSMSDLISDRELLGNRD